ncbi:MAG: Mitochondrial pyruvate carrier 2 [Vezdaea aestivalis]|nr:MAG: Mitochondrial pyruvate carrier 2 [Vezdaea aestivalis]
MWNGPVGVKTVHFWAPVMKWALVITGISDFYRPPEKLSLTQNIALTGTGIIWTRWCLIIKPKNYLLAAVNFFLGCVGLVQVGRIVSWQRSVEASGIGAEAEDAKDKVVGGAKEALAKVKDVAGK